MKRMGLICVSCLFLALGVIWLRFASAQDISPPVPPLPAAPAPPGSVSPLSPSIPPAPSPPSPAPKAENIYDLLSKLDDIKTRKAELEKAEKETMAQLREELKKLQQRSEKLGVSAEEDAKAKAVPPAPVPSGPPGVLMAPSPVPVKRS